MLKPKFRYMIAAFSGSNREFQEYLKTLKPQPANTLITFPTINRKEG